MKMDNFHPILLTLCLVTLLASACSQNNQKTNTLKIVQSWESQESSPFRNVKQEQYAGTEVTAATFVCVRGLHAFYDTARWEGKLTTGANSIIRSSSPTKETCVAAASVGAALSSRNLGNFDFTKPSITIWSKVNFTGSPIVNVSNPVSSSIIVVPGVTLPDFGSIVTTGTGLRYFFSMQQDFYSSTYVKCLDTFDSTSDNRFYIQDIPTKLPELGWAEAKIRAVSWAKSATGGPPGMAASEAAKLICVKALDQYGRKAPKEKLDLIWPSLVNVDKKH